MRSSLSLLRATGLAQGSLLQQAAAPVASSSCLLHGLAGPQREDAAPTAASRPLPSVASLLGTSSLATAAPRSSTSAAGVPALVRSLAHFAGPEPPGTSIENWAKFRAAFNSEKKNSLGPAYYAMILVFGFFHTVVHVHEFPPRVLAVMALTFVMLYVRRTSFSLGP